MKEWILIFGMMVLTFIPRYIPMALADRFHIPPVLRKSLEYVPIAVLSAIIAQTTFVKGGTLDFSPENAYLYGVIAAFATSLATRKLFLTILIGLIAYVLAFNLV